VGHTRRAAPDAITDTLQQYADRGVFRGFSVTRRRSGRREYRFTWLTRRPTTIDYDAAARALTFRRLLPAVRSRQMIDALNALVANRASREWPSHKRLDRRKAGLASSVRGGDWSLTATIRGANDVYTTRLALNLVNELFLLLHESFPDYLDETFGVPDE
jgi:hypothetical protein